MSHSFGGWVRQRSQTMQLTQSVLADRVGCATITIAKIERDERRPSVQIAALLAHHLNLPPPLRSRFIAAARGQADADRLPGDDSSDHAS